MTTLTIDLTASQIGALLADCPAEQIVRILEEWEKAYDSKIQVQRANYINAGSDLMHFKPTEFKHLLKFIAQNIIDNNNEKVRRIITTIYIQLD